MQISFVKAQLEDFEDIKFLSSEITKLLRLPKTKWVEIEIKLPEWANDPERKQWNAEEALKQIIKQSPDEVFKGETADIWVIVTSVDLFTKMEKFSFGLARQNLAIISTFRFLEEKAKTSLYQARLTKTAAYFIAMALGLRNCSKTDCLAAYTNAVVHIDLKDKKFCPICTKKLQKFGLNIR